MLPARSRVRTATTYVPGRTLRPLAVPSHVTAPEPCSGLNVVTGVVDGLGQVRQTSTSVGRVAGVLTWISSGLCSGFGKSSGRGTLSRVGPIDETSGRGRVVSRFSTRGTRI